MGYGTIGMQVRDIWPEFIGAGMFCIGCRMLKVGQCVLS